MAQKDKVVAEYLWGMRQNPVEPVPTYSGVEKRRCPRYKCEGKAEIFEEHSQVRTWATFTNVSAHGCYVESTVTYPVGTVLQVKLNALEFQIYAKGNVRVTSGAGMGMSLTPMSDEERKNLDDLIRAIS